MKFKNTIIVFILFAIVACQAPKKNRPQLHYPKIGEEAANFILPGVGQDTIRLSDYRGQLVIVDFWASWCGPCRKKSPMLVSLYQQYKSKKYKYAKGLEMISISQDNKEDAWLAAIENDHLTWPQANERKGKTNQVSINYGVEYIPCLFLINAEGKFVLVNPDIDELKETLNNQ